MNATTEPFDSSFSRRLSPATTALAMLVTGIWLAERTNCSIGFWIGLALVSVAVASRHRVLGTLLLVVALGALWYVAWWSYFPQNHLSRYISIQPQTLLLRATVTAPIAETIETVPGRRERETRTLRTKVEVTSLREGLHWRRVCGAGRLIVRGATSRPMLRGDQLTMYVQASRIAPPRNPGTFDFALYERRHRRLFVLVAQEPRHVHWQSWSRWRVVGRLLDRIRSDCSRHLQSHLGSQSPLSHALVLGYREKLGDAQYDRYVKAGVIHLLAISGLHVGMLASGVWFLRRLGLLSRKTSLLVTVMLTVGYAMLTGANPPVIRATILLGSFCLGQYSGRVTRAIDSLAVAGIIILAWNPCHLFLLGVQLSFVAVAALIWLGNAPVPEVDPLEQHVARTRPAPLRLLRKFVTACGSTCWVCLALWIITTPLVLYHVRMVSPIAILLNPVLSIPVAISFATGIGVLTVGRVVPGAAGCLGWFGHRINSFVQSAVDWGLGLEGSYLRLDCPGEIWLWGYGCCLVGLLTSQTNIMRRVSLACMCGWLFIGVGMARYRVVPSDTVCTFIAVGHGTSVLVEFPGGETLLYDAGSLADPRTTVEQIAAVLRYRRVHQIDTLVLSHADIDHYGAASRLLEEFPIRQVVTSDAMFRSDAAPLRRLRASLDSTRVPLRIARPPAELAHGQGFHVTALQPEDTNDSRTDNENSLVLVIVAGGRRLLLPGDTEGRGMQRLLEMSPVHCDVVMAPHHGSLRSSPAEFLNWCRASVVVISAGGGHRLRSSEQRYRELGTRPILTDRGAVQVTLSPAQVHINQWHRGRWKSSARVEQMRP